MKTLTLLGAIWMIKGFSIWGAVELFGRGGFWSNFGGVALCFVAFLTFLGTLVLAHEFFRRKPRRVSELFSD